MSSKSSWNELCPERVAKRAAACVGAGLRVEPSDDPTRFSVTDSQGKRFRCRLGSSHSCSCASSQPCLHVLFVLISYFKIETTNAALWQRGVSEVELCGWIERRLECSRCVFCREAVAEGLTCVSCHAQFHERCFQLACDVKRCEAAVCPRCSAKVKSEKKSIFVKCESCGRACRDEYFQCLLCSNFALCSSCYRSSRPHSYHPFSQRNHTVCQPSAPAVNPVGVAEMQYREINPEDYEALASLDTSINKSLTSSELSRIPLLEYGAAKSINQCCPICQEIYLHHDICLVLSCGHTMHRRCGLDWLSKYSNQCPIDHIPVTKNLQDNRPVATSQRFQRSIDADRPTCAIKRATGPIVLPPIALKKVAHSAHVSGKQAPANI